MNITSDSQQLTGSASEIAVSTTGLKSVNDQTKPQKTNNAGTDALSARKSDTVQISKKRCGAQQSIKCRQW